MGNKDLILYMDGKSVVDREEIITRFSGRYKVPPYEKLTRSYIASKIAQALAAARDEEGRRLILARRSPVGIQYVNIGVCEDPDILVNIRKRINKDILGQKASLEKVELRIDVVCEAEKQREIKIRKSVKRAFREEKRKIYAEKKLIEKK